MDFILGFGSMFNIRKYFNVLYDFGLLVSCGCVLFYFFALGIWVLG